MRINARLDDELDRKLETLCRVTGLGRSEVLREALRRYHADVLADDDRPGPRIRAAGFVGCGDGPEDLSERYKEVLAEELGHGRILTTDQRDFGAYRWKSRAPFENLLFPAG